MSTHDAHQRVPILQTLETYASWRIKLGLEAMRLGVDDFLDSATLPSAPALVKLDADGKNAYAVSRSEEKVAEHRASGKKAISLVAQHLGAGPLSMLRTTMQKASYTAADLLKELESKYKGTNKAITVFSTLKRLLRLKYEDGAAMQEHIDAVRDLIATMTDFGLTLDDQMGALILLLSMPDTPEWDAFQTPLLTPITDANPLTFARVEAALLARTIKLANDTGESANAAMIKRGGSGGGGGGAKRDSFAKDKDCLIHGRCGHASENCNDIVDMRKKRNKKKKQFGKGKGKPGASANRASASDDDGGGGSGDEAHVVLSPEMVTRLSAYLAGELVANSSSHCEIREVTIADTGASRTMCPNRVWFRDSTFKLFEKPLTIRFGDNSFTEALGSGQITYRSVINGEGLEITLNNVLYVPAFKLTLVSVGALDKKGYTASFGRGQCRILKGSRCIMRGERRRGLYHIDGKALVFPTASCPAPQSTPAYVTVSEHAHAAKDRAPKKGRTVDVNLLHRRLGHLNFDALKRMVNDGRIAGVTKLSGKPDVCEHCALGKMKRLPFPTGRQRATRPLQLVHVDLCGPVSKPGPAGELYAMTLTDDFSAHPWTYFLKRKSEALSRYRQWRDEVQAYFKDNLVELELSPEFVQFLRSDNGGEFTSQAFEAQLAADGVKHETTAPYTPQQNGVAERMNQTLVSTATTMLIESGLPPSFWVEAMRCATELVTQRPSAATDGRSPYEVLFKRRPDASRLRPFGCLAYKLVKKEFRAWKFGARARKCVLLGYNSGSKDYRLYDLHTRKVVSSRDVLFDENRMAGSKVAPAEERLAPEQWGDQLARLASTPDDPPNPSRSEPGPSNYRRATVEEVDDEDAPPLQQQHPWPDLDVPPAPPAPEPAQPVPDPDPAIPAPERVDPAQPRRSDRPRQQADPERDLHRAWKAHEDDLARKAQARRERNEPELDAGDIAGLAAILDELRDDGEDIFAGVANSAPQPHRVPRTLREARAGPEARLWEEALQEELGALQANDVYEEVPIPDGVKPITSKPVMRIKYDADGRLERYKLRIVARGFVQREGIDYEETFAPVANLESVRVICALAAKYNLELDQMDVSTAFLNGKLDEDIYLLPPDGVDIRPGFCWRLKRSLYGLKQAGRTWNKTFDRALLDLGFVRLNAETCLYVLRENGKLCFLVVYVDDLLLAATDRPYMDSIKRRLGALYKMRDLGAASSVLGIKIERDRANRTISLSQEQYVESVLKRFGMQDCRPVSTPMHHSAKLSAHDERDDTTIPRYEIASGCVVSYPQVIGSLMYAMLGTRPDLAFAVGVLGRYAAQPKRCHWEAAKRVLRYLRATASVALVYEGSDVNTDMDFHGFSDADWSGDPDNSRSTSGYVFISNAAAIGWSSKQQTMVALSTTESEYIGLSNAGQHLAWLRSFFEELGHPQKGPTSLGCDNQAAIILTRDPQFRARTKHIARKYHFVRDDLVASGQAQLRYVNTHDQVADIFTKALSDDKHRKFMRAMGLRLRASGGVTT